MTDYKTATLKELGLEDVEFPEGFTPRWYAGDSVEEGVLSYTVFERAPKYISKGCTWIIGVGGEFHSIGKVNTNILAANSLIEIVEEEIVNETD